MTILLFALLIGCAHNPRATDRITRKMSDEIFLNDTMDIPIQEDNIPFSTEAIPEQQPEAEAPPLPDNREQTRHFWQSGIASWYGMAFEGRRTASGERYDMHALTAAHRTLPLGSYARVTAIASSRSVIVRINDRGPYIRGRVIDLSYAAAAMLGLPRVGTMQVGIERVEKPNRQQATLVGATLMRRPAD